MNFKHMIKYGNAYYMAGENVPIGLTNEPETEPKEERETKETLSERSVKSIKLMALKKFGSQIEAVRKDDVIAEYLRMQEETK